MQSLLTLVGNVVNDVVVRETSGGTVANFRMACDNGYLDRRTKQWVERTTYLTISAWRALGDNVATSVRKGQPVVVVGRPRQREFERDGQRVTVIEVDADLVGHDLGRGSAQFVRTPRGPQTADLAREAALEAGAGSVSGAPATYVTDGTGWAVPGLTAGAEAGPVEAAGEPAA